MESYKRIYFDIMTGKVIQETGFYDSGMIKPPTIEEEIQKYKILSERNRDTFDVIELELGQYTQDFTECDGYRVDPITKGLEFSYPDPNQPEAPQAFHKPLSEEVKTLKAELKSTQEAVDFLIMGGM